MASKATIRQRKYDKEHTKQFCVKMNLEYDADIIEKLASVESMNGYIKALIRADIARGSAASESAGSGK